MAVLGSTASRKDCLGNQHSDHHGWYSNGSRQTKTNPPAPALVRKSSRYTAGLVVRSDRAGTANQTSGWQPRVLVQHARCYWLRKRS